MTVCPFAHLTVKIIDPAYVCDIMASDNVEPQLPRGFKTLETGPEERDRVSFDPLPITKSTARSAVNNTIP